MEVNNFNLLSHFRFWMFEKLSENFLSSALQYCNTAEIAYILPWGLLSYEGAQLPSAHKLRSYSTFQKA